MKSTPSSRPIWLIVLFVCLYAIAEVRSDDAQLFRGQLAQVCNGLFVRPSLKYSCSGSLLRFLKGRIASITRFWAAGFADECQRVRYAMPCQNDEQTQPPKAPKLAAGYAKVGHAALRRQRLEQRHSPKVEESLRRLHESARRSDTLDGKLSR